MKSENCEGMNDLSSEKRSSEKLPLKSKICEDLNDGKRMAKRQATCELNQDNWDKEEEQEDPGIFHRVSDKVLQSRVIKVAKRRSRTMGEDVGSPFSAFSGFPTKPGKLPDFSFLTKTPATVSNGASETKQNGLSGIMTNTSTSIDADKSSSINQLKEPSRDLEYYRQLKVLNESFVKWIQMHLSKNPYCDFTPVVKDYQTHIKALDTKFPLHKVDSLKDIVTTTTSTPCNFPSTSTGLLGKAGTLPTFNLPKKPNTDSPVDHNIGGGATTSSLSFTSQSAAISSCGTFSCTSTVSDQKTTVTSDASTSNVGTPSIVTSDSKFSGFSFKLLATETKPFSFACTASASSENKDQSDGNDDDTYEPPKNEFTPVNEEESVYSVKCKLFYKKEDNYIDRGVGMLHLKPLDGKTQLLVRADTNLGNILLNILLSATIPMQRLGKNNVLIACVPNPPVDSKQTEPMPFLIRVKTSEEADKLLEKLIEHKS